MFSALGLVLLLDRGFLALGNLVSTVGVIIFLSPSRFYRLFLHGSSLIATSLYMLGLILVLSRYVIVGGVVQTLGFLLLFKPFMATFGFLLKGLPLIGGVVADTVSS
ncbi:Got1 family protein, putative [Giardia lamblia P15]|uniref:Got1 family protein, putative n=1 Tax=Giardia intestinalis (strain P15) TaxID=658858 RepID=E1F9N7_GIAIA|nr:Got1 family protein, putative [Giardia lamblia P15]